MIYLLLLGVLTSSYLLTAMLRRYAIARSLMDVPNQRSSHKVATPRGGGVAIVVSFLLALPLCYTLGLISFEVMLGSLGASGLVALIGFLDDHGHIAARWRLLGHFAAAAWGLFWLQSSPQILLFGHVFELSGVGYFLVSLYLVWMLNLYNFMDGIDGLASLQAITTCVGGCLLYIAVDAGHLIWAPALLALAVTGFLCWNFPPARIFMGDAGSGFLGLQLGLLSLYAMSDSPVLLWGWIILMGCFIVDATFTLIRRLVRGDKVYEAHRSHGYQYASRAYGSHLPVTLGITFINLFWLLPIALLVVLAKLEGVIGVVVAYAPLVLLAVRFNAGKLEQASQS